MFSLSFDSNPTFKVFFNLRKAHKANLYKLMNPTISLIFTQWKINVFLQINGGQPTGRGGFPHSFMKQMFQR